MKTLSACSALKGIAVYTFSFPYLLPFLVRIGLDHNSHILGNNLFDFSNPSSGCRRQEVFLQALPDKENTDLAILVTALCYKENQLSIEVELHSVQINIEKEYVKTAGILISKVHHPHSHGYRKNKKRSQDLYKKN